MNDSAQIRSDKWRAKIDLAMGKLPGQPQMLLYVEYNRANKNNSSARRWANDPQGFRDRLNEYRHTNPDKASQYASVQAAKPGAKERAVQVTLRSQRKHPGRARTLRQKRLDALANCESTLTKDQWWDISVDFRGLCAYGCGSTATTIEHLMPISLGGGNTVGNVVPACKSCNCTKNAKTLVEFLYWRANQ